MRRRPRFTAIFVVVLLAGGSASATASASDRATTLGTGIDVQRGSELVGAVLPWFRYDQRVEPPVRKVGWTATLRLTDDVGDVVQRYAENAIAAGLDHVSPAASTNYCADQPALDGVPPMTECSIHYTSADATSEISFHADVCAGCASPRALLLVRFTDIPPDPSASLPTPVPAPTPEFTEASDARLSPSELRASKRLPRQIFPLAEMFPYRPMVDVEPGSNALIAGMNDCIRPFVAVLAVTGDPVAIFDEYVKAILRTDQQGHVKGHFRGLDVRARSDGEWTLTLATGGALERPLLLIDWCSG